MGKMYDALQKVEREKNRELQQEESPRITAEDLVLDNKLVSFFAPSSMAAEQFRRLRSYIIKPGTENSPKTILVTSAMAGEGKSLIAINLAIAIATELHSYALIADCDLRNPALSRMFGFHELKGLSDYLTSETPLQDLLVKTSVDKLSILPGGATHENPVELIGSHKMKTLVTDLQARYADRYIILDSSPLLATTEPSVLNDMVDGILFVIKAGDTPRESVQQALKLLDNKKIIGVVLNNMQFKTEAMIKRYFGTNRYYYDYHYSKGHPEPGIGGKFRALMGDMKMFFGKPRSGKKEDR
jgi:exopolysaccharide/PEP-CTERM locus tyrosine autokinase